MIRNDRRGAELREPIEALIRWSTPLMVRGPSGDGFRAEWLIVALRALLAGTTTRRTTVISVDVDDGLIDVRVGRTGVHVAVHDGGDVDAAIRADPAVILGLAAGALTLDQASRLVVIEGDENSIRAVFDQAARPTKRGSPSPRRS